MTGSKRKTLRVTVYVGPCSVVHVGDAIGLMVPAAEGIIVGTEHVIFSMAEPDIGWGAVGIMRHVAERTGLDWLNTTRQVTCRRVAV